MKRFAVLNRHDEVEAIYEDHAQAEAARQEGQSVLPILTVSDWLKIHKDSRGTLRGRPSCLYLDSKHGTVLSPVYLIEAWDDVQIRTSDDNRLWRRYNELIRSEAK